MMIKNKLQPMKWNLYTVVKNLIIRRDKKVVLFGAWMGTKFADNSRYLFQYLCQNKKRLNLDHVIWVTRTPVLNEQLREMGYESYLIGTKESDYWHLKAGTHIICDAAFPLKKFEPDIDTRFSWGAKKIQLWHGVGIKSVGLASNDASKIVRRTGGINKLLKNKFEKKITSYGGWNTAYYLCTSKLNIWINQKCTGYDNECFFVSGYPRNCKCVQLMDSESHFIECLKKYKTKILYVPTFRSEYENYEHPLKAPSLIKYLKKHNCVWIEKPHTASDYHLKEVDSENVLYLSPEYDINTLYDHIDVVITDYSSAAFDAVYRKIPCILYVPDLEEFKNGDVGFIVDFDKYFSCEIQAFNMEELSEKIENVESGEYFTAGIENDYKKIAKDFFDNMSYDNDTIWKKICDLK